MFGWEESENERESVRAYVGATLLAQFLFELINIRRALTTSE
jgi:hypothetical protein